MKALFRCLLDEHTLWQISRLTNIFFKFLGTIYTPIVHSKLKATFGF